MEAERAQDVKGHVPTQRAGTIIKRLAYDTYSPSAVSRKSPTFMSDSSADLGILEGCLRLWVFILVTFSGRWLSRETLGVMSYRCAVGDV